MEELLFAKGMAPDAELVLVPAFKGDMLVGLVERLTYGNMSHVSYSSRFSSRFSGTQHWPRKHFFRRKVWPRGHNPVALYRPFRSAASDTGNFTDTALKNPVFVSIGYPSIGKATSTKAAKMGLIVTVASFYAVDPINGSSQEKMLMPNGHIPTKLQAMVD